VFTKGVAMVEAHNSKANSQWEVLGSKWVTTMSPPYMVKSYAINSLIEQRWSWSQNPNCEYSKLKVSNESYACL
jgi:hypothetical protein